MRATGVKARAERAAIDLFAARGVDGVSIADIAGAAGISQGALYRHYRSKDELARHLFFEAYGRTGMELAAIVRQEHEFAARIGGMVGHFCALYDRDAALFRFMLLAQHELLPMMTGDDDAPVAAIEKAICEAIRAGEIAAVDIAVATAAIMGIVLQTALFHIYGRITGPLAPRSASLSRAAIAAITALGRPGHLDHAAKPLN
jgi:AcrR family transcriptional regulator